MDQDLTDLTPDSTPGNAALLYVVIDDLDRSTTVGDLPNAPAFTAKYAALTGATFTGDVVVPAEAYGTAWNGSNEVPTKNDVYDKIEAITLGGGDGVVDAVVAGTGIDVNSTDPANPIVAIESGVYRSGGTDVAVVDGGTGSSSASGARTNLGLAIGTNVQAYSSVLGATTASFTTAKDSKLTGVETGADVTDTTNVNAAGAVVSSRWTGSAWPARPSGPSVVFYISTAHVGATAPTDSVTGDIWFKHPDA